MSVWRLLGACAGLAGGVLAAALVLGGGAPEPVPAGLPDPGPLTGWGLAAARLFTDGGGVVMTGGLLTAAFLLPHPGDRLTADGLFTLRLAGYGATLLVVAGLTQLVLCFAEIHGVPPESALDGGPLAAFAFGTAQGGCLTAQVVLAGVVAGLARRGRTGAAAFRLFTAALAAAAAPVLAGHTATAADPLHLSALTLLAHVLAATLWAGGLAALTVTVLRPRHAAPASAGGTADDEASPAVAVGRFSRVALGCVVTVGAAGAATAVLHSGSRGVLLGSAYGGLLLVKVAALVVLAGFGWEHRRRTVPRLAGGGASARRAFVRLAAAELLLM
ncbi:MAG: hypothetical protein GEV11_28395, partial [Streptosporangiales bacterium]|nr:hypothetical protein [Streptosporangiales bacterium]